MQERTPIGWAVLPFRKFAVFSGRAPRTEYWWFYLATIIVQIPLTIIDSQLGGWSPFSTLFSVATLIPWIAVSVRRLHDTNRSGWWFLAFVLPLFVLGIAAALSLDAGLEGGAAAPSGAMIILLIVAGLATVILAIAMLIFMVSQGTDGPNHYGPDPYGPDNLEEVFA